LFGSSIFCAAFYPVLYLRFVNQHHRNVVANWVNAPTFNALQGAAIGLQLNLCLASGAGEYFQQILTDWHRGGPHIAVSCAYPGTLERGIWEGQSLSQRRERKAAAGMKQIFHLSFISFHLAFSDLRVHQWKMADDK
jgi:hypothetical protein